VASLALGIGANTAIFTILDQLMLRLLPVRDPRQLVLITSTGPHMGSNRYYNASSYPMYQDFQQRAQAFSYVFARYEAPVSISFGGQTERVDCELVSGNFFEALGVGPALGRVFSSDRDDRIYKGHPNVVLSYSYWVTRFSADSSVIGRKILVNNYPMEIVGVSAAGFSGLNPARGPQVRIPIQMKPVITPGWDDIGNRRSQWINIMGRMKPGFTPESARASLQPLFIQILHEELQDPLLRDISNYARDRFLRRQVRVTAAANGVSPLRNDYSRALIVLMCMVGLVLLIACFNVANLLIARAASRRKEVAVRLAIGASRRQLIGQLALESLLLAIAGGAAGLLLSEALVRTLLGFLPTEGSPLLLRPEPDWRILAFNAALVLLTALLFGLAPALQAVRVELWSALKDVVGAIAGGSGSVRLRKTLVIAQVAFSFLLLAGAGLFVKTLSNLKRTDSGFRHIENLISFQVDPSLNAYSGPRMKTFFQQALDAIRAIPGVKAASWAEVPVLNGGEWDSYMAVEGHQAKDGENMQAFNNGVAPGYWATMGVPLLEGRDFAVRDIGDGFRVAIVNRAFAEHFFPGRSPVGRHVGFGNGPRSKMDIEIVGVVENSLYESPRDGIHRQVFVPGMEDGFIGSAAFYIRAEVDSATIFPAIRRKIQELDPRLPIYGMTTLEHQLDDVLSTERLVAALSAAFGALATILAALGLYGVMAFVVARRTKELGLRMALGASQRAVVWMVLRETLIVLGAGVALGIPAAWWLSRYLASQLFGVKPADAGSAIVALAVLAAAGAAAGFLPARRASTIDPIEALRYE
jgi:predicted permease